MDATRTPIACGSADSAGSSAPVHSPETVHLKKRYTTTRPEYEKTTIVHVENISGDPFFWSDEKPFTCPKCRRRYSQQHHLMLHNRIHDGKRQYTCPECEKIFGNASPLKPLNNQVGSN